MTRAHTRKSGTRSSDDALIARAEAAIGALSSQFAGWMEAECDRLKAICRQLASDRSNMGTVDKLYRAAHDIKSEAVTFGFPVMERLAASLCRLLDETHDRTHIPLALIERHVAVMTLALSIDREGDRLARDVERVTAQFLAEGKTTAAAGAAGR
jgi:chemotaxis protein histidine kinase CheA